MAVSVGVIGCGYWGPNLVRAFHEAEGTVVVGVCDVDLDRLMRVGRRYPTTRCYSRADDLMERDDIDVVVVATPLNTHFDLSRAAIERGKHVLVEKPFTRTSAEAEELADLARRQGVLLAVDHTFLFTPAVERIRELLADGQLGRLQYVDSVRINLGVVREEQDVVWDLAPHDLSILDFLIGRMPRTVIATGSSHARAGQIDVAYLNLDYGEGLTANFHLSWLSPVKVRRMILGGDRRMIIYDDLSTNEKVRVYDSGLTARSSGGDVSSRQQRIDYRVGDIWTPHLPPKEALVHLAEHLAAAIQDGTPFRSDAAFGLRVVKVLEACEKSLRLEGTRVRIVEDAGESAIMTLPLNKLSPSVSHAEPVFADAFGLLCGSYGGMTPKGPDRAKISEINAVDVAAARAAGEFHFPDLQPYGKP